MDNLYRLAFEKVIDTNVEESRTIDFKISDESRDRHKTVIPLRSWDLTNFNRNGIVGYQHNVYGAGMCTGPDPDDVIASGYAFIDETRGQHKGALIGRTTFEPENINEKAEKIFRKILFGSLKATSVGFVESTSGSFGEKEEAEGKSRATYYFGETELLEYSVVNIPSNANALRKSIRNQTTSALLYIKKALGGRYSFSDIEGMCIGDVLSMLERKPHEKTLLIGGDADLPTDNDNLEVIEHLRGQESANDKIEAFDRNIEKPNRLLFQNYFLKHKTKFLSR